MTTLRNLPLSIRLVFGFTLFLLCFNFLGGGKTFAAYDGASLIQNNVFLNANAMSATDIQNFLNSKGGAIANRSFVLNCDTAGQQAKQVYLSIGAPCDQTIPASRIIFYAAQVYGINPQVILATMQKEQSLITAPNPTNRQFVQAMGYGCPTTGSCDDSSNFFWQVDNGTWVLRFHYERARGNMSWWYTSSSWTCGTEKAFYKPSLYPGQNTRFYDEDGVLYRTYNIANAATSSMYCYTPHAYNNPQGLYGLPVFGTTGRYYTGSYNFVRFFESWFGSLYGADYDWEYQGISFSNGSADVTGGSRVTVTITAKNMGRQAWSNTNFPVRLGTFKPTNHASALYDSSWVSQARPATLNQSTVQPGENGTFTFIINVPNRASEYYLESFNLVAEGAMWMPDHDFTIGLNITKQSFTWRMVSQSSTNGFDLRPGATSTFTLVAKNTGNVTWNNSSTPVRLATWEPSYRRSPFDDGTWVSSSRAAELQESSVAPGQNGTFVFTVKAPTTAGFYAERFNLVMEGVAWFEDPWMEFNVNVGDFYKWQMVSQTSSTGSFAIPRNTNATLTLRVRNTGNVTWNNSSTPARLATWEPSYRTSIFNDGSWPSQFRAATLTESSVAPGAIGTFTFNIRTPNTPRMYVERFNLVSEGAAWHTDPWMEFNILVQ